MGVLQRVTGWLSGLGSHNAQTAYSGYGSHGYYGSSEAENAYGGMYANATADMPEENAAPDRNAAADRFGTANADQYGGRVPYRSQRDMLAEQEERDRQAQEEYQQRMQSDMRHRRADAQPQQYAQQPQQPAGNVVNFPGGQQASAPVHVEYVILLRSRNECTKVIEYIKTNASVFLNMEYIANEGERQRCVDMLSGAAYTLGCQLHKISNRGIYLIASPYVRVMIDPAMKRFASTSETQPFMAQQTGEYPPVATYGGQQPFAQGYTARQMSEAAGYTTAPYPPQQFAQQQAPQQAMHASFQRPRPTFQSQQQAEPFRRAAGEQHYRQPASYQTSF